MSGAQWFSTIDLWSEYWQIEVDEADRIKRHLFVTMACSVLRSWPFGLCNAPTALERVMEVLMSGLQWDICLVYIDDMF